jgi:methionyl-tRNA formyltransferase
MKLLLLTTADNAVRSYLFSLGNTLVLDWADFPDRATYLDAVSRIIATERDIDCLLTYRCPYFIPYDIYASVSHAFNLHPSLLPKYPGLNPWPAFLESKDLRGGVTLHELSPVLDGGQIILQAGYYRGASDNLETLRNKADRLAAEIIKEYLETGFR